jgi:hypothetical protein
MNGYKTYVVAAVTVVFAVAGYVLGEIDGAQLGEYLVAAAVAFGLRHGIATSK